MDNEQQAKKWYQRAWFWGCLAAALITGIIVAAIVNYLRLDQPRHWWPASADDWTAWGTWVGGLAGSFAVVFAAIQLRSQVRATQIASKEARQRSEASTLRRKEEAVSQATAVSIASRATSNDSVLVHGIVHISNPTAKPLRHVQVSFNGEIKNISDPELKDSWGYWQKLIDAAESDHRNPNWFVGTLAAGQTLSVRVEIDYEHSVLAAPPLGGSLFTTLGFTDVEGRTWTTDEDGFPTYRGRLKSFKNTALQIPD